MWYLNYILNQKGCPAWYADTLANRPAAGYIGRLFVSTDTFAIYRDTGAGWDLIGGPGSGTITGTLDVNRVVYSTGSNTVATSANLLFDGTTLTALNNIVVNGFTIGEVGNNNIVFGLQNYTAITGFDNIAIGSQALRFATTASTNIAVGSSAMLQATTATWCVAVGYLALRDNTTGEDNTAIGYLSMRSSTGVRNTAVGSNSFNNSSASNDNTAIGYAALDSLTVSNGKNTGVGGQVLSSLSTGENNTAIGYEAGFYITGLNPLQTNTNSVFIGANTRASANGNTNEIVVGYNTDGNGSNTVTIGNNSIVNTYLKGAVNFSNGVITKSASGIALSIVDTANGNALNIDKTGSGFAINVAAGSSCFLDSVLVGTSSTSTGKLLVYSLTADNHFQAIGNAPGIRFANNFSAPTINSALGLSTTTNNYVNGSMVGDFVLVNNILANRILNAIGTNVVSIISNTGFFVNGTITTNNNLIVNGSSIDINPISGNPNITLRENDLFRGYIVASLNGLELGSGPSATIGLTIDNLQNAIFANTIKTGAPGGGTAAAWKMGIYVAGAPVASGYVQIDIAGVAYKLLTST